MALGREDLNLLWVLSTAGSPAPPSLAVISLLLFLVMLCPLHVALMGRFLDILPTAILVNLHAFLPTLFCHSVRGGFLDVVTLGVSLGDRQEDSCRSQRKILDPVAISLSVPGSIPPSMTRKQFETFYGCLAALWNRPLHPLPSC